MIKLIKQILTSAILHERMVYEFKSVFCKKPKEKTYPFNLTEHNMKLLIACYKYGIIDEAQLYEKIQIKNNR